jgi:hypothetical protein
MFWLKTGNYKIEPIGISESENQTMKIRTQ